MSIEQAINRMSGDTRDYLKNLVDVYKKTRSKDLEEEIVAILRNHGFQGGASEVQRLSL